MQAESLVHLPAERGQRLLRSTLRQLNQSEHVVREPALRIQLECLVRRRLRFLQKAGREALVGEIPMDRHVQRIKGNRSPKQSDRLFLPAEISCEGRRAA